jgi:SlyX protein
VRQQEQIDRLVRELVELRNRAAAAEPDGTRGARDELPPHY